MSNQSRLNNVGNDHQGTYRRVLCVCSSAMLRSPTAALVLSQAPYNYNTRAVGIDADHALIIIDKIHLAWADEIVCMDNEHVAYIKRKFQMANKTLVNLQIPDNFTYRDAELIALIKERYASRADKEAST